MLFIFLIEFGVLWVNWEEWMWVGIFAGCYVVIIISHIAGSYGVIQ